MVWCRRLAFAAAVAAAAAGWLLSHVQLSRVWHEGPQWRRFLALYDVALQDAYGHCEHLLVNTSFGATSVHVCGAPTAQPLVLLHGFRSTSALWSFLVPALRARRVVLVDYICDVGLSVPTACPESPGDHARWVRDVLKPLGIQRAAFVGYSYGSFVAASVALVDPALTSRLVLCAPAGTFAPLTTGFQAAGFASIVLQPLGFDMKWFMTWMAGPGFNASPPSRQDMDLALAVHAVLPVMMSPPPRAFTDAELVRIAATPTVLVMPEYERATDSAVASARAQQAGVAVTLVQDAGHLMSLEKPVALAAKIGEALDG